MNKTRRRKARARRLDQRTWTPFRLGAKLHTWWTAEQGYLKGSGPLPSGGIYELIGTAELTPEERERLEGWRP